MSPDLISALRARIIEHVPVELGPRDDHVRSLYWVPGVRRWCEEVDSHTQRPAAAAMLAPSAELNQAFADFVAGKPLTGGFTRCSPPAGEGVWKLHTPHMRLFGCCIEPQSLVLTRCEWAHIIKGDGPPSYNELARAVVADRKLLGFNDCHVGDIRSAFPASGR